VNVTYLTTVVFLCQKRFLLDGWIIDRNMLMKIL